MATFLFPVQAAQRAGGSRRTITRALARRELPGERDNLGHWRIDADALDAWSVRRQAQGVASGQAMTVTGMDDRMTTLMAELAAARADNAALIARLAAVQDQLATVERLYTERLDAERERREGVERDRDAWRGLAERASASWWSRLIEAWRKA